MQPVVNRFADLTHEEIRRFSRHLIMPEVGMDGQRRLKASSILLIGTGGLGSPLALYLAAAGVGRIGLVDYDTVDDSNLQRQVIHGQSSVGQLKVDSAKKRMLDLNPNLIVDTYNEPLTSDNALRIMEPYDIIIDGTDNFPTRYLVNDACVRLGKPNVYGSILRFEGQLSVFYAKEGPCYRCMFPEPPPPGLVPSCAEAGVLGILPGTIGTMQATEGIKLITGIGEPMVGRMMLYDALDMSFTTIKVRKDPNCPVCGIPADQVELIDYEQFCGVPAHDHVVEQDFSKLPIPQITAEQLKERYELEPDLFVLDVRNPEEWEIALMPNTVKITKGNIEMAAYAVSSGAQSAEQTVLAQIPRDRDIIVHCRTGVRSISVIETLRELGYDPRKLINMEGGIVAWARRIDNSVPVY